MCIFLQAMDGVLDDFWEVLDLNINPSGKCL